MNAQSAQPVSMSEKDLNHPRSLTAFRSMKILIIGYFGLSLLTLVAIVLLRNHTGMVNQAVWVRGTIVAATSLLMLSFAVRAARGSRKGFLRVRITSAAMVVAIVVIIALPGTFPVWLKIEQAVCGLVLIGVVVVVNGKHLRSLFAAN
ncbi:MAG: putative integral rane protein [Amycolatopsis sp.]|nr:putative integral rane protein [Amycolatopsis sp.]